MKISRKASYQNSSEGCMENMDSNLKNSRPRRTKEEFGSLNLKVDKFSITVVNIVEKSVIAYDVTEDTIMLDVKKKMSELTEVNADNLQLVFHGRHMDEEELLFYTLVEGDRVVLVILNNAEVVGGHSLNLLLFFDDGMEAVIKVNEDTSMLVIKQKMSPVIGVTTTNMVLTMKGNQLEDTKVVGFYKMEDWDMLKLRVFQHVQNRR